MCYLTVPCHPPYFLNNSLSHITLTLRASASLVLIYLLQTQHTTHKANNGNPVRASSYYYNNMLNLTHLEERIGLMSSGGGGSGGGPPPPFYYSPVLSSSSNGNGGPNNKQSGLLWPHNQPGLVMRLPRICSSGWDNGSANETIQELIGRVKGPFTPLQWMELEHQALIYKYLNANAPVPSSLLVSLCQKIADPSMRGYLGTNRVGWGHFQIAGLPLNNGDLEPGRCRRTDGKKWRCAKNAMPEHKYCERHMVRSRHRSRKPVEKQNVPANLSMETEGTGKVETSVSHSSALLGRPYPSKEKTSTKSLNFENSSTPNSLNSNPIVDTPLQLPAFAPVSSSTMLNFSGSSYLKNNSYMSSSSASPSGSESPPHLLQDFIGELTKISPQSDPTHIDLIGSPGSECSLHIGGVAPAGGPLGEILGNSNHDKTNPGNNNNCYPNAFINSLGWSLG